VIKHLQTIALAVALAISPGAGEPRAQTQDGPQSGKPDMKPGIPLQVQVVISRFQGDKKVSSLPYTLAVNAGPPPLLRPRSQLRVGAEVPWRRMDTPVSVSGGPVEYKVFGTNIDCGATPTDDGRFQVALTIEDSSVFVDGQAVQGGVLNASEPPIMRSFRFANELTMRDGQSAQFTAATDRITGEAIRVDVTINVIK